MTTHLLKFMDTYKTLLEDELANTIERLDAPANLKEAMDYSLQAGGKRIRPMLLFAAIEACGKDPRAGLSAACSLEMIHTYSLIHDDLPSMDDDDLRRGMPTNHKKFGEALAILSGDALLTYSFQLICSDHHLTDRLKVELIHLLASCSGPEGMVGGQVADIEGEKKRLTLSELEYIHHHKTGRLLTYSVLAGAKIGGASMEEQALFEKFSNHIGLAFQISDDILDIEGDESVIGKPVGSDDGKSKSTYPALLTLEGAKSELERHILEAKNALNQLQLETSTLEVLADLIAKRDR